jgi:geranylgeranyl pyrophosphate synthase
MHSYGYHLGVIIQILDDAKDFLADGPFSRSVGGKRLGWSLPVVFAMEVLPLQSRTKLEILLDEVGSNDDVLEEIVEMIRGAGADLYLRTQLKKHSLAAQNAIKAAAASGAPRDQLTRYVELLVRE